MPRRRLRTRSRTCCGPSTPTRANWARLDVGERLSLLDRVREDMWALKDRWIEAECEAKGIPPQSLGVAEEWVMLAQVFRAIAKIQRSLHDIQRQGRPLIPGPVSSGPNGRLWCSR